MTDIYWENNGGSHIFARLICLYYTNLHAAMKCEISVCCVDVMTDIQIFIGDNNDRSSIFA